MFTLDQIKEARTKVVTGEDFPKYIQEIKQFGVLYYETFVADSHTDYFGLDNSQIKSNALYEVKHISDESDKEKFMDCLRIHQQGGTDYFTFSQDCAEAGIERWIVRLDEMSCTYYDKLGNEILVEKIPVP
ncbi:MAG: DUF1398 family protein [Saprospiraceae bacterium]